MLCKIHKYYEFGSLVTPSSQPDLSCFECRELVDHRGEVSCLGKTSFNRQKRKTR